MKPKSSLKKSPPKAPAERVVKDIRRATRRHFSAEDKIRIVLEGRLRDGLSAGLLGPITQWWIGNAVLLADLVDGYVGQPEILRDVRDRLRPD
ncbi:hypothetical protein [Sphingopyxis sp. L1A2A]|uniref:hypothetical protein n=1 Tax=Sphingopyxis sp. L1A2A TaxID=2502247 RepID=UPI001484D0B4|nr:hypothetical protein [Sphingopyxis sp. L1A2A]